jgi:type IV pilus assembly protein PilV
MSNFPHCTDRCRRARTSGFSLLEVLISLVIMSVGLLGVAGLISTTLKGNDSAYMRTQATAQAYNIIDRMRANMDGVNSLDYVLPMPAAPSAATAVPAACTGFGAGCSSATLAAYDIAQWEYELAKLLPQGRGSISTTITPTATTYTVTVLWNDSRANQALGGAPAATTFSLAVSSSF